MHDTGNGFAFVTYNHKKVRTALAASHPRHSQSLSGGQKGHQRDERRHNSWAGDQGRVEEIPYQNISKSLGLVANVKIILR